MDEIEKELPESKGEDEEEYHYSLWSATLVTNPKLNVNRPVEKEEDNSITVRNQSTQIVASASASHYLQSTWKGLEQRIGETPVQKATEGLSGIPKQYQKELHENEQKTQETTETAGS